MGHPQRRDRRIVASQACAPSIKRVRRSTKLRIVTLFMRNVLDRLPARVSTPVENVTDVAVENVTLRGR